jgi:hypothetical protein
MPRHAHRADPFEFADCCGRPPTMSGYGVTGTPKDWIKAYLAGAEGNCRRQQRAARLRIGGELSLWATG